MKEIISKADELVDCIKDSSDYKEYIKLKNILLNNNYIMKLIDDVKLLQKQIVKDSILNKDVKSLEEQIADKLELLNSNPDYLRYTYLEEDLNNKFQIIKHTLEKHINNITN